jgi:hypothetical protein
MPASASVAVRASRRGMVRTIASSSDQSASSGQPLGDHVGVAGGPWPNRPATGRFRRNQPCGQRRSIGEVAVVGDRDPAAGGVGLEHRLGVLPVPATRGGVAGVADRQVPLGGWPTSPRRTPASPAPSPERRARRDHRRQPCRPTPVPVLGARRGRSPSGWSTLMLILPKQGVWERHADANRFCAADTNSGPLWRWGRLQGLAVGSEPAPGPAPPISEECRQAMAAERRLTTDPCLLPHPWSRPGSWCLPAVT